MLFSLISTDILGHVWPKHMKKFFKMKQKVAQLIYNRVIYYLMAKCNIITIFTCFCITVNECLCRDNDFRFIKPRANAHICFTYAINDEIK